MPAFMSVPIRVLSHCRVYGGYMRGKIGTTYYLLFMMTFQRQLFECNIPPLPLYRKLVTHNRPLCLLRCSCFDGIDKHTRYARAQYDYMIKQTITCFKLFALVRRYYLIILEIIITSSFFMMSLQDITPGVPGCSLSLAAHH